MEKLLKTIIRQAGHAILKKWGKIGVKYTKENATDVVTEADLIANKIIVSAIKKKFPSHGIISEEIPEQTLGAEYTWIIDPLDGTRNFSRGTSLFGVMIGVACKGRMIMGGIYLPVTDELFFAKKGGGAFKNNKKIHSSTCKKWNESWGCVSAQITDRRGKNLENIIARAHTEPCWISASGCAAVAAAYCATGQRDWVVSEGGGVWDFAAPTIILSEAGLKVTNRDGRPWTIKDRGYVAAPQRLYSTLKKIVI